MGKIRLVISCESLARMLNTIDERIEQDEDGYCEVRVNNRQLTIQHSAYSIGCEYGGFSTEFKELIPKNKLIQLGVILKKLPEQPLTLDFGQGKIAIIFAEI